jgi:hypothetical protein
MNPDSLFQHARARFEHESARRLLREKYESKMLFAYQEGMWRAGPELITLLQSCQETDLVLLDLYSTPVRINRQELCELAVSRWQEQMTAWLLEYQDLQNKR